MIDCIHCSVLIFFYSFVCISKFNNLIVTLVTNRGFYTRAHDLINLLNELGKEIKCVACQAFDRFFAKS